MYTSAKKTGAGESTRSCRKIVVKRQAKSCYLRAIFRRYGEKMRK